MAELCGELGYPTSEAQLRGRFRALAGSENHLLLVVLDDDENVVGWIHAHVPRLFQTASAAQIRGLVVEKARRGGRFGRLLMVEAEMWSKRQGCGEVRLRSDMSREDAHRFYEALGYEKPHPEAFRGVLDALCGADEVWMIGDNADADVAGAKAASIPAILVRKRRRGIEPYCEVLGGIAAIVDG